MKNCKHAAATFIIAELNYIVFHLIVLKYRLQSCGFLNGLHELDENLVKILWLDDF